MNKRLLIVVTLLIALPLYADFRSIERTLRARLGEPTWIPFLGLVRVASNVVHPKGVHDFQLAACLTNASRGFTFSLASARFRWPVAIRP